LVRERERDTALKGPDRRREPREADDSVQDDVRLGLVQERGEVSSDLRVLDATLGRKRVELVRTGGERAHVELGLGIDDLEGLAPDRPGRAEDGYPLHAESV